jgi:hypothetical protein
VRAGTANTDTLQIDYLILVIVLIVVTVETLNFDVKASTIPRGDRLLVSDKPDH